MQPRHPGMAEPGSAESFIWKRHPQAQAFVDEKLTELLQAVPPAAVLSEDVRAASDTRLSDWVDHIVLAEGDGLAERLAGLGFQLQAVPAEKGDSVFAHTGAIFPLLVVRAGSRAPAGAVVAAALRTESVSRFLMMQHIFAPIEGTPLAPYRRAHLWKGSDGWDRELFIVERRGFRGLIIPETEPTGTRAYLEALEAWQTRPRDFMDAGEGAKAALSLASSLASAMGTAAAAWIILEAERAYWKGRNRAGAIQNARQESVGLGWANHDHHTFRSSRAAFAGLVRIFETLGFKVRERFYAGTQAGWGAQVMEQPEAGLVIFADVDLAPEELAQDFAHGSLEPRSELGTVGLWCALHGESILDAGMHHLACRMDFQAAIDGLGGWGISTMPPFSDLPHLRQAFTKAEAWKVSDQRLDELERSGGLDRGQAEKFRREGAIGSHLEKIQRGDGFKGFNQKSVSDIIRRTDPRKAMTAGAA
jgi:hypothetical protein